MANRYWIDATGIASWDDNLAGITPWASTSGGSDNAATPSNGDAVYFDGNSPSVPVGGPGISVSLSRFDLTGFSGNLSAALVGNVTLSAGGTMILAGPTHYIGTLDAGGLSLTFGGTSVLDGTIGANQAITFSDVASASSSAIFTSGNHIIFDVGSVNNATSFSGSGYLIDFKIGASNEAGVIIAGSVTFQDSAVNNGTLTATSVSITGTLTGSGSLTAAVAIPAGTNSTNAITGAVTISASGTNSAAVTGNVSVTGSGSINTGNVTGNVTLLTSTAKNTGTVSGTLTAPYSTGAGAYGTFGALSLTGLPSSGGGGGIIVL